LTTNDFSVKIKLMSNRSLSTLVRCGFVLVVAGGVVDTTYHLAPQWLAQSGWAGLAGHLVTLTGMVIVMVGVLGVGLRSRHP